MASQSSTRDTGQDLPQGSAQSGSAGPGPDQETSTAQMKHALSSFIAARVELASIEAREAAGHVGRKVGYGIALGISVFFLWALLLACLTGVLSPLADGWLKDRADWLPGWAAVLFGLAVLHALAALICLALLKKKPSAPLFELSRKEMENDKQWLAKDK